MKYFILISVFLFISCVNVSDHKHEDLELRITILEKKVRKLQRRVRDQSDIDISDSITPKPKYVPQPKRKK